MTLSAVSTTPPFFTYRPDDPRAYTTIYNLQRAIKSDAEIPSHVVIRDSKAEPIINDIKLPETIVEFDPASSRPIYRLMISRVAAQQLVVHRVEHVGIFDFQIPEIETHQCDRLDLMGCGDQLNRVTCTATRDIDIREAPSAFTFNPDFEALRQFTTCDVPRLQHSETVQIVRLPDDVIMLVKDGRYLLCSTSGMLDDYITAQSDMLAMAEEDMGAETARYPHDMAQARQDLRQAIDEATQKYCDTLGDIQARLGETERRVQRNTAILRALSHIQPLMEPDQLAPH